MKPIPFNPDTDVAPIPLDERLCRLGTALKDKGLKWQPHVGCFVWDPDGFIEAPSPFPNRIYFSLSMPRFLEIFGTEKRMIEKLVWLPTWHQGRILCRKLGLRENKPAGDLYSLYKKIGAAMDLKNKKVWFSDRVIETELGDTSDLPAELASRVRLVYHEFVCVYLDMLRQRDKKPVDWYPGSWSPDLDLVDDMRHFFSDHQFITRKFFLLTAGIKRLRQIEREGQPELYQDMVNELLQKPNRNVFAEIGFEDIRS